jgi:tetratricopeptide (TPR) repeat protein
MPFHLRVLGPVTVSSDADADGSTRITQPRPLLLLVVLALARPRGLQPRESLMALLWPDHDAARARRGLRNALHEIRRVLDPQVLIAAGDGLVGLDPRWVRCDAIDLELGAWRAAPGESPASIEPFHGLHVAGARGAEAWMDAERTRLRQLLGRYAASHAPVMAPSRAPDARAPEGPHGAQVLSWYLRGHYCFLRAAHDGDPTTLRHARTYFERALALDDTYAPAVAGLSNYWAVVARRGVVPFEVGWAECRRWVARTLELSDAIAVPHVHLGTEALYQVDDFEAAGVAFQRAIAADPTYAEGHRFLAIWLALASRNAEALAHAEEAARLEPAIPQMLATLAAIRWQAGDMAGAEAAAREALTLDPRHGAVRDRLLRLLERQRRWSDAVAERQRGPASLQGSRFAAAFEAEGAAGYRAMREDELRHEVEMIEARLLTPQPRTVQDLYAPPVLKLVAAWAELGEWGKVRAWRLQAVAERPILARWFATMPELREAQAG